MTNEDLKKLAEAVELHDWFVSDDCVACLTDDGDEADIVCEAPPQWARASLARWPAHAAFIAAANPKTIFRLLSEIEAKDAEIERLRAALKPFAKLTVNGELPAEYVEKYPLFAAAVENARAALKAEA